VLIGFLTLSINIVGGTANEGGPGCCCSVCGPKKSFFVSNNNIRKISPSLVSRNRNKLTYLDVSNNRLERVERNTFARLTHLATLDLHGNVIKYVSSDAFNRNRLAVMLFRSKRDNRMKKLTKSLSLRFDELVIFVTDYIWVVLLDSTVRTVATGKSYVETLLKTNII